MASNASGQGHRVVDFLSQLHSRMCRAHGPSGDGVGDGGGEAAAVCGSGAGVGAPSFFHAPVPGERSCWLAVLLRRLAEDLVANDDVPASVPPPMV